MPLYLVPTPLGNLGDISPRAKEILLTADVIFAEDTRVTGSLLQHLGGARARLVSAHEHNQKQRAQSLLEALEQNKSVALVSDAGTPLVSDPGESLVREAIAGGHDVISIPGPSAVVTALAASGFSAVPFAFFGFLERKGEERTKQLAAIRQFRGTVVLFESKERIAATLEELATLLGEDTQAVVARELSKMHETYHRGTLGSLETEGLKGEMTLVIAPREQSVGYEDVDAVIRELRADPRPLPARAKELTLRAGVSRKDAYRLLSET